VIPVRAPVRGAALTIGASAAVVERAIEVGQRGVAVRSLGGGRAGEIRLTRLLRTPTR